MNPEIQNQERENIGNVFEALPVETDFTRKYKIKEIGRGGESVVFEVEGRSGTSSEKKKHERIVAKANIGIAMDIVEMNRVLHKPTDHFSNDIRQWAEDIYLRQARKRFYRIRESFGNEHVPNQRFVFVKAPVTPEILDKLYQNHSDQKPGADAKEMIWLVTIQEKVPELKKEEFFSICGYYAEHYDVNPAIYDETTKNLVFGDKSKPFSVAKFLNTQPDNSLIDLLGAAEMDAGFRVALKDFVLRAINFANETGEALDLSGSDNVIFHMKKGGGWTYKLVDPVILTGREMCKETRLIIRKFAEGRKLSGNDKIILLNVLNFTRIVNGLAASLGIEKRVDIVPEGIGPEQVDFKKIFFDLKKLEQEYSVYSESGNEDPQTPVDKRLSAA